MAAALSIFSPILAGFGVLILVTAFLWDWPHPVVARVSAALRLGAGPGATTDPVAEAASRAVLDATLSRRLAVWPFLGSVLWASVVAIVGVGCVYAATLPAAALALLSQGDGAFYFLRQVALSGFVTVLSTTYMSFSLMGYLADRAARGSAGEVARLMLLELVVKLFCLILATGATYALFAMFFGSFGGDWRVALRVTAPTMAQAALFENLSSVYLYAALLTGFPLGLVLVLKLSVGSPATAAFWRRAERLAPFAENPIRSLAAMLGGFLGASGMVAALLLNAARDAAGG